MENTRQTLGSTITGLGVTPRKAGFVKAADLVGQPLYYWGHTHYVGKFGEGIIAEFTREPNRNNSFFVRFTSAAVIDTLNDVKAAIDALAVANNADIMEFFPVGMRLKLNGRAYELEDL